MILDVHSDARGNVRETFRASWDPSVPPIVQLVRSCSRPNVMRAMHAHKRQWDIWHFVEGDVLVQLYDHRTGAGEARWIRSDETLFIPPGISHGFYTPTGCTLMYALTREYDGTDEYEWNAYDPQFPGRSAWPSGDEVIRSARDLRAPSLADFVRAW